VDALILTAALAASFAVCWLLFTDEELLVWYP